MATLEGLDPNFAASVQALLEAADGKVWIKSGYRSVAEQQALWETALKKYGSPQAARKWVAPPGNSNHNHGIAVDLGGDLELAGELASRFGLTRPMSWEPWHFEPAGARDGTYQTQSGRSVTLNNPEARTTPPEGLRLDNDVTVDAGLRPADPFATLRQMLRPNIQAPEFGLGSSGQPVETQANLEFGTFGGSVPTDNLNEQIVDQLMRAIRSKESSGNYRALGSVTKWGRASGAYQYLDMTWGGYKGFARASDAPRSVQDEKARQDMQKLLERFGDPRSVAAAWFSGPNGNWESTEVRDYVQDVMDRVGQRSL